MISAARPQPWRRSHPRLEVSSTEKRSFSARRIFCTATSFRPWSPILKSSAPASAANGLSRDPRRTLKRPRRIFSDRPRRERRGYAGNRDSAGIVLWLLTGSRGWKADDRRRVPCRETSFWIVGGNFASLAASLNVSTSEWRSVLEAAFIEMTFRFTITNGALGRSAGEPV